MLHAESHDGSALAHNARPSPRRAFSGRSRTGLHTARGRPRQGVDAMTWIKVRTALLAHPKVVTLALRLGVTKSNALGALVALWCCADEHADDGTLVGATKEAIDAIADLPGFADALESVGWLTLTDDGAQLPRYQEHNGKTAKDRAQAQKRVAKARARVTLPLRTSVTRGEERREEKNTKDTPPTPQGGERAPLAAKSQPESKPAYPEAFERFWAAYPPGRKAAKRKAFLAWGRAIRRADPERIIEAAAEYAASPLGRSEFVAGPEPWLNGDRWDDDRSSWQRDGTATAQADPALAAADAYHKRRRAELAAEEAAR